MVLLKRSWPLMLNILQTPRRQVIDDLNVMTLFDEIVDQMAADEPGGSGHQHRGSVNG